MPIALASKFLIVLMAVTQAPSPSTGGPGLGAGTIEDRVAGLIRSPGFERGRWGLLVVDSETGSVVYERAADELFRPASTTKLYSTAAALVDLGADYRFETPVVHRGAIDPETKTLEGDLILVAQGDPSLGGRTGPDGRLLFRDHDHIYAGPSATTRPVDADPLAGLDHLAREVADSGIAAVAGDVLIDDRRFEAAESTGSGPLRVSPIVVNDNLVDVVVTPAANPGEPAVVTIAPMTAYVRFDASVTTAEAGSAPRIEVEPAGPRGFTVRGRVPAGEGSGPYYQAYAVEDPASYARALFIESLRRRGVKVSASPLGSNRADLLPARETVASLPKVAQYLSPPLSEYVRVILKVSQNLHASTLPLLLAAHHQERTLAEGLRREGEILRNLGLEVDRISFGGAAGGSRADLVSPRSTVALLRAMAGRPEFAAYESALPILGRDGTLAEAVVPESPARGHVRAKTGTFSVGNGLTGGTVLTSKALAGYMETAKGRSLTFCFFVNDVPLGAAEEAAESKGVTPAAAGRLLGKLCETFYDDAPPAADANASTVPKPEVEPVETPAASAGGTPPLPTIPALPGPESDPTDPRPGDGGGRAESGRAPDPGDSIVVFKCS